MHAFADSVQKKTRMGVNNTNAAAIFNDALSPGHVPSHMPTLTVDLNDDAGKAVIQRGVSRHKLHVGLYGRQELTMGAMNALVRLLYGLRM